MRLLYRKLSLATHASPTARNTTKCAVRFDIGDTPFQSSTTGGGADTLVTGTQSDKV